jgi:hypothetical protein
MALKPFLTIPVGTSFSYISCDFRQSDTSVRQSDTSGGNQIPPFRQSDTSGGNQIPPFRQSDNRRPLIDQPSFNGLLYQPCGIFTFCYLSK